MQSYQKQYGGRFVRHLVYHLVEENWYREKSQIWHSARTYVIMLMRPFIQKQVRGLDNCPWRTGQIKREIRHRH